MEPGPSSDPEPDMDTGHEPVTGPGPVTDPATDPDVEPLHRGGFRCRLCQITTANRPSLLSHLAGKRHRRLRCLRAERRSQEQRSLFVSGFPRGTEPARLRQHFRAFGDVATVVMDKERGAFAIVELREPAGRQRALEQPRHVLGGRRLRVRPREHRPFPRTPPRDPPGTPPAPPGLLQALGQAQDVGAQLQLLVRALELSAAERRLRHLLLTLIREVFSEFFPGCSVVPYGSSVNGFDVHGCDLDLHLELGEPPGEGNGDPQSPETPNRDPQSQETPNGDPQSPETPNGDPQSQGIPNRDPQSQGTPNGDPQSQETPNGDPQSPETPNGDPQSPETPNRDPQSQGTPNRDPQSPETPNRDPQSQGTPNGDPQSQETPNGDPQSPETPNRDPQSQGTPNRDPQSPETPNRDPQSQGTPNRDPQSPETPNGDLPPNGSLLGSGGSLLGDREPPLEGSFLGSEGSHVRVRDSVLGSEGSRWGSGGSLLGDPSLEGSVLGSEGSPLVGSETSLVEDKDSISGSEGSLVGDTDPSLEGSHLGSEGGSLLGDKDSLEGTLPAGSPSPSDASPSGDESPEPEGSLVGSGGSLVGSGGSLLGRGAPPEQVLALVGAVLRRCVPGVRGVRALPAARRPVVKFSHKQSGLAGDVCLDNRLALFNSRFLRLCADADPRVRPLGYALRLWAGRQRLAGNRAGGGPLLTNYALTLLLVLFLQSRSPPVLPSVRRLRHLAGPQDRAQVGGWDCSFPRDVAELEPSGNTQSAASLLAEFFSYFGSLDLGGLLLSPLEGRALPRPPPETLGGLRPGPLTLQDPFELSHNVAANVTARTVSRFSRCCRDAARLCRGPEFWQKSRRGRPWGVMRLLRDCGNCGNSPGKFLIAVPTPPRPRGEVCAAVRFVLSDLLGCGCDPEGTAGTPPGGHLGEGTGGSPGEFGVPGDEEELPLDPSEPPAGAECHLGEGTGGCRGEFGTLGTPGDKEELPLDPSEPPTGAECHLEEGTGGSPGEFGTLGTPGDEGKPPAGAECHLEEGTGGSRGEFGTLGTPGDEGKPPAGAECHLEEGTGGSPGEFGTPEPRESPEQPLVDLPGSEPGSPRCHLGEAAGDSRGEFGDTGTPGKRRLPSGVPNGAGVPPAKRPRLPSVPSRWSCCVWYRVWRGRRRLRRRLRARGGSGGAPGAGDTEGNRGDRGLGGPEGPGGAQGPGGAAGLGDFQGPAGPGGLQDLGEGPDLGGPGGVRGPGGPDSPGGVQGPGGPDSPGGVQGPGGVPALGGPGGSPLALERAVTEAIIRGDTETPPGLPPEPLLRFQLSAHPGGSRRDPQMLLRLRPEGDPPSPLFQEFFHFLRSFLPGMVRLRLGGGGAEPPGGEFVHPEVFQ